MNPPLPPANRTGIILGVVPGTTAELADHIREQVAAHFPGVVIAVVIGATNSIAFEFYDPYPRDESERA